MSFFKNTATGYSPLIKILHWLSALMVLVLFFLGLWMTTLTYYSPWYQTAPSIHISIGFTLVCIMLFRLVYRLLTPQPDPIPAPALQSLATTIIHYGFYLAIFCMFISGYLIDTLEGQSLVLFGYFELPAVYTGSESLDDLMGKVHLYLAYTIIGMAVLHALAALKHHFIDKDETLKRMVKN